MLKNKLSSHSNQIMNKTQFIKNNLNCCLNNEAAERKINEIS